MYPYDTKIPATVPLGKFHARVWISAGKVWFMLHDEPDEAREFRHGVDWQPFAKDRTSDPAKAAASFTACMYEADAAPIREPLAALIAEAVAAYDAKMRGGR